ncbi:nucleotidyltransferase [Bacillus luteolus]|uniref:tRNA(Met) cytidine acetate ligase n=1 Tax=Litchfieldia luteola TaxID=682179 RepID=A0ABR9QK10_9BACI|nr:nucleotidyltransferase [Cytobacillus luteolus]MBE4908841.1 nucleotidyltransferase [Cytobacillus luteolus]MBP1941699.1 putative nucleotidyltransferase [Cytobacillus luteolus]
MKSVGVVVEYNPFHNGHLYHIEQTRKHTNADCIVAVMSGNFLQRGEPALLSKWYRTKMALQGGADIVIELPYAFATQKAEIFANGSISILDAIGCSEMCFGSEHGTIIDFNKTVSYMIENEETFNIKIKNTVKQGYSYPKAASLAYYELEGQESFLDLSRPNNILGYHYVKAIKDQQSSMKPTTIQRTGAGYHDVELPPENIASATSIRKALLEEEVSLETIKQFVPVTTSNELKKYLSEFQLLHSWEDYFSLLKYKLMTLTAKDLENLYEMEEGLENRLISHISNSHTFEEFMKKIKTKRYTWTRLQRACCHILTHTTKQQMSTVKDNPKATYLRLLGMTVTGQRYLKTVKKDLSLPLVANLSSYNDPLLELDKKAANTYSMIFPEPIRSKVLKLEYSTPPIRYNEENVN